MSVGGRPTGRPLPRSILVGQHDGEDSRCLGRVGGVLGAEFASGVVIVDLPKQLVASLGLNSNLRPLSAPSAISSPPWLLRLLPAGAVARWGSHPLESAAFHGAHVSRRTRKAVVADRGGGRRSRGGAAARVQPRNRCTSAKRHEHLAIFRAAYPSCAPQASKVPPATQTGYLSMVSIACSSDAGETRN